MHMPRGVVNQSRTGILQALIRDLTEGLHFALISHRTIVMLILMASLYTFGTGAFTTLFPVCGKSLPALGPVEAGYLWSWLGMGLLVVSLVLMWLSEWNLSGRLRAISVSSLISGTALWGLVRTHDLVLATLLVAVIGMGFGAWTPIAWGLIQELAPAHIVGRVMVI